MPGYAGNGRAVLLSENQQGMAWNNETVPVGATSVAFQLRRTRGLYYPNGFSVEIVFGGAPGTFEVDVLTADNDLLSRYVVLAKLTTGLNSYNVGRVEITNAWAKFVCLQIITLTNAVNVTATVTR